MTILLVLVISTIIVSNNDYGSVQITSTCEFSGSTFPIINAIRKNLIRYNIIVSAIVLNELFLTVLPDIILIILPDTPYRYALFTLTLVKDLINVIVINFMQKHLYLHYLNKIVKIFKPTTSVQMVKGWTVSRSNTQGRS
uniref:G-protein coupled receptors family 1 profile domain-containing protein n=1 Tax=Acrobeloides nanus TaxID=290746 RepID=A0A914D4J7_9BILA